MKYTWDIPKKLHKRTRIATCEVTLQQEVRNIRTGARTSEEVDVVFEIRMDGDELAGLACRAAFSEADGSAASGPVRVKILKKTPHDHAQDPALGHEGTSP